MFSSISSVDVLTRLYHDFQSDTENEEDSDSENLDDSGGIETYQKTLRSIMYLENNI